MFQSRFPRRPFAARSSHRGLASLVLALGLAAGANLLLSPKEPAEGRAYAVDGDTIRINEMRIRLKGIDAPELEQTCVRAGQPYLCGEEARNALVAILLKQQVECRLSGRDRYRRSLARCTVEGKDIGARLVEEGWAVAYGGYTWEETRARHRAVGLWAGSFDYPREWRRKHGRST
ncbi:thermonuclease family protein [Microvirga terricola]|uniref:Thermonuclease family protein n=1 Tax=Microvirga terricola TaxID=2719797 RepID=A0ABX0VCX0_9HYPH|nr:thermonuclease family protein [Microvirga terricola]NIX76941.1 thermonuclease family protein [Microvirga terricola]